MSKSWKMQSPKLRRVTVEVSDWVLQSSALGRVGRTIQDLEERILQKTGPLIGWARANQIPPSHLGKL